MRYGRQFSGWVCAVCYQSSVAALADVFLPVEKFRARVARDALLIASFTPFVVLLARLSIHLPLSLAPLTRQTFAMLVTGATLANWLPGDDYGNDRRSAGSDRWL